MTENEKTYFQNYNMWIQDNTIRFGNLSNQRIIPEFINSINRLVNKFGHKEITLNFAEVTKIFPFIQFRFQHAFNISKKNMK